MNIWGAGAAGACSAGAMRSAYTGRTSAATAAAPGAAVTDRAVAPSPPTAAAGKAAQVQISEPSQLYSKLQELQQKDPEKFIQVVSDFATDLKGAAAQQGDTRAGRMLAGLAAKFEDVAGGGDITQLQPPPKPRHGHGMKAAYAQAAEQAPPPPPPPPVEAAVDGEETEETDETERSDSAPQAPAAPDTDEADQVPRTGRADRPAGAPHSGLRMGGEHDGRRAGEAAVKQMVSAMLEEVSHALAA